MIPKAVEQMRGRPDLARTPLRVLAAVAGVFGLLYVGAGGLSPTGGAFGTTVQLLAAAALLLWGSERVVPLAQRDIERVAAAAGEPGAEPVRAAVPWTWRELILFYPTGITFAITLINLVALPLSGLNGHVNKQLGNAIVGLTVGLIQYVAFGSALVILTLVLRGARGADLGLRLPRHWAWWILPIPLAFVGVVGTNLLAQLSLQLFPHATNGQCAEVKATFDGYLLLAVPLVCLAAPFTEELVFRGFLQGALRRYLAVPVAVVLCGVVFGAFHVQWDGSHLGSTLILFVPLSAFGIMLGWTYHVSRSLFPGMLTHALFNLAGIVAILGAAACTAQ